MPSAGVLKLGSASAGTDRMFPQPRKTYFLRQKENIRKI